MYGYGSYHHANRSYVAYGHNRYPTGEWYGSGDEPGPSYPHSSNHYGDHDGYDVYANDSQYSTQAHYRYNGGYYEPGAPPQYEQSPANQDDYGLYQHARIHQDRRSGHPPRAPKAMRDRERELERSRPVDERSDREATPPPVPSPSPEYLALAADPPSPLSDPTSSRKLLVLDLNGTLVFRSPHASRPKYPPHARGVPRPRPTYPRPYMRAFREYVFAPATKAWFDVMVWSSAQPHSVADMVDKTFGARRQELVAVWARDTLGLSTDHYHRKIQTIKDLSKPWAALPALLTPLPPSPSHSPDRSTPPPSSSPPGQSPSPARPAESVAPQAHSALTTLLLDDSPKKAAMQPYNHFCIPEYTQERRNRDLESFRKEQEWRLILEKRRMLQSEEQTAEDGAGEASTSASPPHDDHQLARQSDASEDDAEDSTRTSKKRKRNGDVGSSLSPASSVADDSALPPERKKENKKAKRRRQLEELARSPAAEQPQVEYDETLLAVVGVLDAVRCQSNVAAWIRAGGLWGPGGVREHLGHVASLPSVSGDEQGGTPPEEGSTEPAEGPQDGEKKRKKPRHRALRRLAEAEAARKAGAGETEAHGLPAGNDEATEIAPLAHGAAEPSVSAPETPNASMWFEDLQVMGHWAKRGREVLEGLSIPVEHGMEW
ncbi:hypothetical protein DAEQUDRAFT_731142 [Daedalea quercina L-15889]|uniref:FCP1 homology domain-containing protein n=1 Tax=Daedalea quercina L-15889 TaxID=1314783 RepID=A0A165MI76_9APHY|nr:hypothetical protein DAEQUDRAFT_731142 [Daedalea quercina L-15889]